ncbi:MAG TPA: tRNA (guanosine(37)-N1)-methyltransferase TrmD [Bacilli bacterium]|nr:tRNA (guanosine(37)-N1)-methyltransferase TrmD [Bacilli bacterium]HPS18931.1 tRNA (guanosine(37)-N1)-methyltransferase TrmD [Bacilli bacterium]
MRITILTLFPQMFDGFLTNSIIKRAIAKQAVEVKLIDIRSFTKDRYGRVDSAPVGGGAGLIMKCQPIIDCLQSVKTPDSHVVLLSPRGKALNQSKVRYFTENINDLVIICGHYEGVDERVNRYVDELISIGDFIMTGGEIGAMALSDAIIRLIDGVIARESIKEESFENGLLEYPQYTEPFDFEGEKIPDILYSGNHQAIEKWRKKQSLLLTKRFRPDMFDAYALSKQDIKLLDEEETPKWELDAIEKGHKFIK